MQRKLSLCLALTLFLFSAKFAAAIAPTADEMTLSRNWAATRFEAKTAKDFQPFFSFTYDGKSSAELLKTWDLKQSSKKLDDQRLEYTLTFTDPKTGLELRCVGVEYHDFPTVEWTLYFKNTGAKDTPILAGIQALDANFTRQAEGEFVLHYAKGDTCTPDSYQPFELPLTPGLEKRFSSASGRPTNRENGPTTTSLIPAAAACSSPSAGPANGRPVSRATRRTTCASAPARS